MTGMVVGRSCPINTIFQCPVDCKLTFRDGVFKVWFLDREGVPTRYSNMIIVRDGFPIQNPIKIVYSVVTSDYTTFHLVEVA